MKFALRHVFFMAISILMLSSSVQGIDQQLLQIEMKAKHRKRHIPREKTREVIYAPPGGNLGEEEPLPQAYLDAWKRQVDILLDGLIRIANNRSTADVITAFGLDANEIVNALAEVSDFTAPWATTSQSINKVISDLTLFGEFVLVLFQDVINAESETTITEDFTVCVAQLTSVTTTLLVPPSEISQFNVAYMDALLQMAVAYDASLHGDSSGFMQAANQFAAAVNQVQQNIAPLLFLAQPAP